MTHNEILKKLRIALDLKEPDMLEIFWLADYEINKAELAGVFRSEGHKNYKPCSDDLLKAFLDGFIIYQRGPKEG